MLALHLWAQPYIQVFIGCRISMLDKDSASLVDFSLPLQCENIHDMRCIVDFAGRL